jgi:hypothetical protein
MRGWEKYLLRWEISCYLASPKLQHSAGRPAPNPISAFHSQLPEIAHFLPGARKKKVKYLWQRFQNE